MATMATMARLWFFYKIYHYYKNYNYYGKTIISLWNLWPLWPLWNFPGFADAGGGVECGVEVLTTILKSVWQCWQKGLILPKQITAFSENKSNSPKTNPKSLVLISDSI